MQRSRTYARHSATAATDFSGACRRLPNLQRIEAKITVSNQQIISP